ncbi:hypothetical protein [Pedobacter sp. MR2016-24]|uniref:hypothetical protein n=1 Tax=Pedobacter sp. MR2016-24 TaxID=2994466 RepID=UPI002246624C|nr:hypothetical protein [Pedobacter sp. MR2016-24]MCX2483737.1 hypothetical protein [Pedobacter sp. MR2016-24]
MENTVMEFPDGIVMRCLSPSVTEAELYTTIVDLQPIANKAEASRGANYLSTIFKITTADKYILLTSDSEVATFKRLVAEDIHKNLYIKELNICQLSHHGSIKNYHPPFWDYVRRGNSPQAVVSAGLNATNKHPHLDVLINFHNQGYKILSTNIVYGMAQYFEHLKSLSKITAKLDSFTDLEAAHTGGDKSFDLSCYFIRVILLAYLRQLVLLSIEAKL